jgi:hypothetical protein
MIRILRQVVVGGEVTDEMIIPLHGPGNPLRKEIVSLLHDSSVWYVVLKCKDHEKVYCLVDSAEGTTEGSGLQEVDDEDTSPPQSWFQRALVRVCTEICRRGMGS